MVWYGGDVVARNSWVSYRIVSYMDGWKNRIAPGRE